MVIEKIKVSQIKPAEYNPRKDLKPGDPEYEKLKRSMSELGYIEPIVWNKQTGNIVGGHQRYKILLEEGATEVECVVVDYDPLKEKQANIALNKINGDWNMDALERVLKELDSEGIDISLTGFDFSELEEILDSTTQDDIVEDDFEPELPKEPISKLGDIWHLGNHRVLCGDSTKTDTVKTLMGSDKVRMIFTDPPWNVDYGSDAKHPSWKPRTIMNDKMSTEDFGVFLLESFSAMKKVSEPGCMTYVVMSAQEWGNIMNVMRENGYHWSSTIIWKKDSLVLSRKDYHTQYEPLWYGWLDGTRLCPLTDRKQSDVWDIPRPKVSEEHPTMKPIALVSRAILNSSHKGDIVLDLFGGSGTTLIAAEQTGRACRMMELDPKYCDVIVDRFIKFVESDEEVMLERDGEKISYPKLVKEVEKK